MHLVWISIHVPLRPSPLYKQLMLLRLRNTALETKTQLKASFLGL